MDLRKYLKGRNLTKLQSRHQVQEQLANKEQISGFYVCFYFILVGFSLFAYVDFWGRLLKERERA